MTSTLIETITPKAFREFAAAAVDFLKINSVSEKFRHGRPVVVKRRNGNSEKIAESANLYFRLADIPIRFWSDVKEWQRWEVNCFRMLNGDRFNVLPVGTRAVCADKLPGRSLWDHLTGGTLNRGMLQAAGKELRRAHQLWSDRFRGSWSHADATMTNFMYDEAANRARLIDFEIVHCKSLSARARHADDLLVFLLDLAAMAPKRQWLPLALCFIDAYGNEQVISEVSKHLTVPSGLARIWWNVRTSFTKPAKVKRRLEALRNALQALQLYSIATTERARRSRRPSIICQAMSPGIPSASSRTLAISESAKAASPGMPSRLPINR
jgi:hypothetical protein